MEISLAAAMMLNTLGLTYCGDKKQCSQAVMCRYQMKDKFMQICRSIKIDLVRETISALDRTEWLKLETSIRLAHSMWLQDRMLSYHLNVESMFTLHDIQIPVPCSDELWKAENEIAWKDIQGDSMERPTLPELLQTICINRSFPSTHSEFVRVLTIHGLFHRLWEVHRYYSDPLSQWEPTTVKRPADGQVIKSPAWLPAIPAYRKWQNVACDALDVLHWQANATIGKARDVKSSTVLHLHFARIALMVPSEAILRLAEHKVASTSSFGRDSITATVKCIQRWAVQHQYKARLAMIHAGVVF
jgi:hypothetical protein